MKKIYLLAIALFSYVGVNAQCSADFEATQATCSDLDVGVTFNFSGASSGGTATWDFGTGASTATLTGTTSAEFNPTGITYSAAGAITVTLTVTGASLGAGGLAAVPVPCGTNTVIKTINITPIPTTTSFTTTAASDLECANTNIDFTNTTVFTGTNTLTYLWDFGTDASPRTSTAENPTGIKYSTAGTKSISFQTSNANGCTTTAVQTLTITATPDVSFTSTAPKCTGLNVDYTNTGTTGATYLWDFGLGAGGTATPTDENPTGVTYSSAGSKIITLTTTVGTCSVTATNTININQTPTASFTSDVPKCVNEAVAFTNTGSSASNWAYNWDLGLDASPKTSSSENPQGITYSSGGNKTITLTVYNNLCTQTATQVIAIDALPIANAGLDTVICENTSAQLGAAAVVGHTYSWVHPSTLSSTTIANPVASPVSPPYPVVEYILTITETATGCKNNDTVNVTISTLPLPVANAGADTIICANTSVALGSTAVVGNTYSWFPTSTLTTGSTSNPTSSPVADETEYIVTVTETATGCVNYDTINVTMLTPLIADAGIDVIICRNDSVQLGAGLIEGQVYNWAITDGLNDATVANPTTSPDSTTTYVLTVTGNFLTTGVSCPAETDEVMVTVNQLPLAFAGVDDSITVGETAQLSATGGVQYTWLPMYALNNTSISMPMANPERTTEYEVEVIDIYGCINYDTMLLHVFEPAFWTPTAFTPNGDGKSDVFYVRGDGIDDFEFGVLNRWGEQLFYTTDINTGWDGNRTITGKKLPAGAYVYYIKGLKSDGEVVSEKGIINLIR